MSIIKKNDAPTISRWLDDFWGGTGNFFDTEWLKKDWMPAVNIHQTDSTYEIELASPGLTKDDFNISLENNVLTISAENKNEDEEKKKNYTRREFKYTSFSRSFTVPENVSQEDIKAEYSDGVLRLKLAKKDTQPTQKKAIEIS